MPNPITPVSEFTEEIVAPDGDDFMNDAADVIELGFQGLANRDKYLKDQAVLKNQDNTIEGQLNVDVPNTPDETKPALKVSSAPTGTAWRPGVEAACDDDSDRKWTLYQGTDDNKGAFAIVVNARWHIPTSRWRQQTASKLSMGLIMTPTGGASGLVFSMVPAGTAPWETWPGGAPENGTIRVGGGAVIGDSAIVNKFLLALETITAQKGFVVGGDEGDFDFASPRARARSIIGTSHVSGRYLVDMAGGGAIGSDTYIGDGDFRPPTWSLRVPAGCQFGKVHIMHNKTSADDTVFTVRIRKTSNWNLVTPTPPSSTTLDVTTSTMGTRVVEFNLSGYPIGDGESVELQVIWSRPNSGAGDRVYMVSLADWTDGGPRNEVL